MNSGLNESPFIACSRPSRAVHDTRAPPSCQRESRDKPYFCATDGETLSDNSNIQPNTTRRFDIPIGGVSGIGHLEQFRVRRLGDIIRQIKAKIARNSPLLRRPSTLRSWIMSFEIRTHGLFETVVRQPLYDTRTSIVGDRTTRPGETRPAGFLPLGGIFFNTHLE